jgi:myo-inositol-1(or 4)-monophosphatase
LEGRRRSLGVDALGGTTKSTQTDLVTEFDRAAEATIVETLRTTRPGDSIVGEEGTADRGSTDYSWFVDPIDGTTSFVYDLPTWSCSIGVAHGETMVAGAVYAPALDEMFDAVLGGGARLNGHPIGVSTLDDVALALVGTGFSYHPDVRTQQAQRLVRIISRVRDIRRTGSAALDLCFVAAGRFDVYFEQFLNVWDAAAGELIAREAGAVTSDFGGGPARPDEIVAATPGVHAAFLDLLGEDLLGEDLLGEDLPGASNHH